MANLLKELAAALESGGIETPEPGYMTCVDHSRASGYSRERTSEILRRGVEAGKVEQRNYRVRAGQRILSVPHYKVLG